MSKYYITTIGKNILLKEESACIYKYIDGEWELSGFWWDKIKASDFMAYKEISEKEAQSYIQERVFAQPERVHAYD